MRLLALAALLLVAAGLVVRGVAELNAAAAWIAGGVALGVLAVLFLVDVDRGHSGEDGRPR